MGERPLTDTMQILVRCNTNVPVGVNFVESMTPPISQALAFRT